jgi:S-adenosylmethionine synthetase
MFEKVNPAHPDKIADRIAGALVDEAYRVSGSPRIAVEVLIGHHVCFITAETSVHIPLQFVKETVERISGRHAVKYVEVRQDRNLARN